MKTAISIDDRTFEAGEAWAQKLGLSRSELYVRALRQYLREQEDRAVTDKLNEVYGDPASADPDTDELVRNAARRTFERTGW